MTYPKIILDAVFGNAKKIRLPILLASAVFIISVHLFALGRYPACVGDVVLLSLESHSIYKAGEFARLSMPGPALYHIHAVFPPLIPFLMAVCYRLFGFGVWQSQSLAFFSGVLASVILFRICRRLTDSYSAAVATLVFALDGVISYTWLAGRVDSPLYLIYALILWFILDTERPTGGAHGLIVGLLLGLLGFAYYPLLPAAFLTVGIFVWFLVWNNSRIPSPKRVRFVLQWLGGSFLALGCLGAYLLTHWDFVTKQLLSQSAAYYSTKNLLLAIQGERSRYAYLIVKEFDLGHVVLFSATLVILLRTPKKDAWTKSILCGVLVWVAATSVYMQKHPRYLANGIFLVSLGVAIAHHRAAQNAASRSARFYRILIVAALILGFLRLGMVGATTAYQWSGRDYSAFSRILRQQIPAGTRVIAPLSAWHALAEHASFVHIYTQGGSERFNEPASENWLNNSDYLNSMDYIVIQESFVTKEYFPVLLRYVRDHLQLIGRVDPPFKSLPWAKTPPYRMDIYARPRQGG
ncbi:MAG: glycosyltransferase family 39 protein [Candidatus Omnitrophica bacterium]|nr:glycosyltransferase family 39 protein [Candidatus Omnitrophota bacterium]